MQCLRLCTYLIVTQAEQALRNIGEVLEAAGGGYKDVIKAE